MRQEFIKCKDEKEAIVKAPWACKYIEVCGGCYCFESEVDYNHFVEKNPKK